MPRHGSMLCWSMPGYDGEHEGIAFRYMLRLEAPGKTAIQVTKSSDMIVTTLLKFSLHMNTNNGSR